MITSTSSQERGLSVSACPLKAVFRCGSVRRIGESFLRGCPAEGLINGHELSPIFATRISENWFDRNLVLPFSL